MSHSIRFLAVNDVYDYLGRELGGFAYLSSHLNLYRTPQSLFVVNGDFLGGSALAVTLQGEHVVRVLDHLNTDLVCLGNHEFDYGEAILETRVRESRFQWLGVNVRMGEHGFPGVAPFVVKECSVGGRTVRVGVFGLCTTMTPVLSHCSEAVSFEEPIPWAVRTIKLLKDNGCELYVALTHQSLHLDLELARECPELTLILGGHDHHPVTCMEGSVLIVKTGQNAQFLGVIDIIFKGSSHFFSWSLVPTLHDVLPDQACVKLLEFYEAKAANLLAKRSNYSDIDEILFEIRDSEMYTLTEITRKRESSFATLIADALVWYFSHRTETLVGIINGGFIRRDMVYPIGYQMRIRDVLEELPFPKEIEAVRINGKVLRQMLEQQISNLPNGSGSFPHLSRELKVTFDASNEPLSRILTIDVNGTPLEDNTELVLVCTLFMANGGDSITAFKNTESIDDPKERIPISRVVINYLRSQREQSPLSLFQYSAVIPRRLVNMC